MARHRELWHAPGPPCRPSAQQRAGFFGGLLLQQRKPGHTSVSASARMLGAASCTTDPRQGAGRWCSPALAVLRCSSALNIVVVQGGSHSARRHTTGGLDPARGALPLVPLARGEARPEARSRRQPCH